MSTEFENRKLVDEATQLSFFESTPSSSSSVETEDIISLLALARIPGIGFATVRTFYEAYQGHLSNIWTTSEDELYRLARLSRTPHLQDIVDQILLQGSRVMTAGRDQYAFLQRNGTSIIFRETPLYPPQLLDLPNPPAWLFVEGNVELLHDPAIVAVVGTRDPTSRGIEAARQLTSMLATGKTTILSGLAEGIDEVGHQTAVDYGAPTIAILGHGTEVVFPASTAGIRRQIVEHGGAVVSEYLPRDTYLRDRFVQRNRIQAALSKMVAVVEGRAKSGTAHTVRFARQLNRPLFGVRLSEQASIPQQELLTELIAVGDPVFNLDDEFGRRNLSAFLRSHITLEMRRHRQDTPHVFNGLLHEFERLLDYYPIQESDLEWLTTQIREKLLTLHQDKNNAD